MNILKVTLENLHTIKNCLRDQLLGMKSSHVSEALAYALGYQTSIALQTHLRQSPSGCVCPFDESRFLDRLTQLGYKSVPSISLDNIDLT